jgi:hypothetical protein
LLLRINCRREITWKRRIIININIIMPLHCEFRDQLDSTRRWVGWTLGNLKKKRNCVDKDKKRFPFYFYFPTGIVLVFHLASVNVARPDQVSPLTNNDMTLSACHCTQQIITTTLLSLSLKKKGKEDYGSGARKADRICCSDRDSSTSHGSFFYLLLRVLLPFPNLQQRTPNRRKTIVISSHHTTKCIVQES